MHYRDGATILTGLGLDGESLGFQLNILSLYREKVYQLKRSWEAAAGEGERSGKDRLGYSPFSLLS